MSTKIAILGAGESGVGAALLAQKEGYEVFVSDFGKIKPAYREELEKAGIPFEEGGHDEMRILASALVVKSPGIPEKAPMIKALRAAGVEVVSEIEFAWRYAGDARVIAVTGSNGKTTTTSLIHHVLQRAGLDAGCAGNIGESFARQVATSPHSHYVLEVSSFQLDDIRDFRPNVAVLTNITPDHLDRYGYKIENYAASKLRITQNQGPQDFFIYCGEDPITMEYLPGAADKAVRLPFSIDKQPDSVAWYEEEDKTIHVNMNTDTTTYNYDRMPIRGRHNLYNTMAAAVVARVLELRKEVVRDAFSDFRNIEHRLEPVSVVRGVQFINDSKATNVNSVWYALESIEQPIVWIAGGVDKGNDYSILVPLVEQKVKSIVALGSDVRKLHEAFGKKVSMIVNTETMEDAVKMAYHLSDKGDTVLLSPACASFDLFENYEDRGRQFKSAVKQL